MIPTPKRRQLETWQRCEIAEKYWEIEKERARIRKLSQLTNVGDELPLPTNDRERGEALEIAAHKANVGYQTLRKYNYAKKIAPQLILDIQKGELSINKAEKDAKKIEHNIQPERVEIPQAAENLNEKLFLTNVWQLPESRPKGYGSSDFRGNCDPTIIDQCIRRYVMNPHIPEDVILLDPMAGSGTFLDVALKLGFDRKDILAYDLNKRRDDIEIQDVSNLPIDDKTVNLIFCHYPYWDMWKYSEQKQDLSNCDYKEFLRRVTQSFKEFKRVLKKKGYVCVLIGNKRQNGVIDMEADISKIGQEIFGKPWDKIITIVGDPAGHASSAHGNWGLVTHRALKNKWTIQNYDTLLIFRKKC